MARHTVAFKDKHGKRYKFVVNSSQEQFIDFNKYSYGVIFMVALFVCLTIGV
jgi:hypothetical protein